MRKFVLLTAALALAPFQAALSGYSQNISSTVSWVKIYNSEVIFFQLANQPSYCTTGYFVVSSAHTSEKQRDRYYAMLLAARAAQTTVSVGYGTDASDCVDGSLLVHALTF